MSASGKIGSVCKKTPQVVKKRSPIVAASSFFRGGHRVIPENHKALSTNNAPRRCGGKMTHSVKCSPDQYKRLCEYAQTLGKTLDEAVYEAVEDYVAMPDAEKRELVGRQNP
jgi:hypothetical protein